MPLYDRRGVSGYRQIRFLLWSAIAAYAAGFSALSILRHEAFNTGRFDLGNMVQAVWSTAHGHPLEVTNLAGDQVSRLGSHFDPILAAFAPLWWLWPSPSLLLTAQAAAISLGALPVFWLARKHLGSDAAGLGFALAYLLYPPLQWLTLNEFHPGALAVPLLLYAFWYLDEDRLGAFAVFAFVALLTREEIGLALAGFGLWYALARGRRWAGGTIAAGSLAAAAIVIGLILPHFAAEQGLAFYSRYSEVGGSPGGILRTALSSPGLVVETALDRRGVSYLVQLVLPLAALSLLAPIALLPALPQLAINLLSATPTQTSIHFHYTAAAIPPLVVAAVLGGGRLTRRRKDLAGGLARIALAASLLGNYLLGPIPIWRAFPGGETLQSRDANVSTHARVAASALRLLPPDAVVSASNSLGGHLSERERILSFPFVQDATWIALDERSPAYSDRLRAPLSLAIQVAWLRRDPSWRLVFEQDGVLVARRTAVP